MAEIIYYPLVFLILFFLLYELSLHYQNRYLFFTISLIVIGAISNLIDRWRFGGVVDFMHWLWWSFNLADIYIFLGIILWLLPKRK